MFMSWLKLLRELTFCFAMIKAVEGLTLCLCHG